MIPIYNKPVLIADKISELQREIAMREKVFPEWASGPSPRLKPEIASKRIAVLKEILKDYQAILAKQGTQTNLF